MDAPSLNDLLTPEQQQELAGILARLIVSDTEKNLLKILSHAQAEELNQVLFRIRREGGYGRAYIDMEAGRVKFIGVDIRRKFA